MEIRFSGIPLRGPPLFGGKPLEFTPEGAVLALARGAMTHWEPALHARISSVRGAIVRFQLLDDTQSASEQAHDAVIRALLTLDPDATIRTARAVYEGLADFEAQLKARQA